MRPDDEDEEKDADSVSIHALLAECDSPGSTWESTSVRFNPRTPCGVRPGRAADKKTAGPFQSTHSLRSATKEPCYLQYFPQVSIHALLAECDRLESTTVNQTGGFNPRTPCGVRHVFAVFVQCRRAFQSTHSLRSATFTPSREPRRTVVSIHALLAECDEILSGGQKTPPRFNPRTPCGVRLPHIFPQGAAAKFQSTHSLRSATLHAGGVTRQDI